MPPHFPSHPQKRVFIGTFIHTPTLTPPTLSVLEHAIIGVDEDGLIKFIEKDVPGLYDEDKEDDENEEKEYEEILDSDSETDRVTKGVKSVVEKYGWKWGEVEEIPTSGKDGCAWWFPGFVDTHTHASQLPNAGLFGTSTLLDWLKTYTFPLESRFPSLSHASRVYSRAVASTLSHGTTTCAYYATIHPASTNLLADICLGKGQRAFVGNVCMNCKETCPDSYREADTETSLNNTKAVVEHIRAKDPKGEMVQPIVTPRFAPSCTKSLLSALGKLAKDENLPIQTHISENRAEIKLVGEMFPENDSYAETYDHYKLLTPRTVLAHGVHLSDSEMELIKQRGSGISHCPLSNTSLGSGICPVRKLLDKGIKVGLGTDVSGGGSCSILTAAREASAVSRLLASFQQGKGENEQKTERTKLSAIECLYLATRGGAACLGLENKIGAFEVGMQWDAQMVRLRRVPGDADDEIEDREQEEEEFKPRDEGLAMCWGNESWEEKVAKWMYCGDDRNTRMVWVKGRLVHRRDGVGRN
ncbi:MAG: hypothetical protein Q9166_007080 [cf. Caloplaca sp. 2 TL-2023]